MNIFGIGTDIVSVDRIKNPLKNKKCVYRIFNEKEILKCKKIVTELIVMLKDSQLKKLFQKL